MHTSSVGIYSTKTRNAKNFLYINILKSAVKMYPLLDAVQGGLDLHTWGKKIKLVQNMEEAKRHKSEGMLLQYSGAALVKDTNSKMAQLTAAIRDQVRGLYCVH